MNQEVGQGDWWICYEGSGVQITYEFMVVDFIEAAICKGSSWRGRIRNDTYAGEYRNVIGGDHDGRTDDRVQSGVDMWYEEIEGMTLFVCRDVYMLYKISAIEKIGKFDGL